MYGAPEDPKKDEPADSGPPADSVPIKERIEKDPLEAQILETELPEKIDF